jgi:hypothetical protein
MKTHIVLPLVLLLCGCMSIQERNAKLLQGARVGDTATVKQMLDGHADIDAKDRYGDTALHLALKNKHTDTAELLISRGADVNAKGALGDTPLHVSVYEGQTDMAAVLRQKGADETLPNQYGLNPTEMQALPEIEDRIVEAAQLLTTSGRWTDAAKGRILYDGLRARQDRYLINSLVLQIIKSHDRRLCVLILAIKLGIADSEEKLVRILMVYGDKSMAEDYLNSGSSALAAGGRRWAAQHGYRVSTGPGSHRASWGRF